MTDATNASTGTDDRSGKELSYHLRKYRQFLGWLFVFAVTIFGAPTLPAMFWSGVAVVAAGMTMRLWASGFVRKNKILATNGPYARVRHPLYTGNVLIAIGFSLASGLWWSFLAGALFIGIFYPAAIAYEDKKLAHLFPGQWEPWAKRTPAIVPGLRPATSSDESWSWSFKQSLVGNGEPIYVLVMTGCLLYLGSILQG